MAANSYNGVKLGIFATVAAGVLFGASYLGTNGGITIAQGATSATAPTSPASTQSVAGQSTSSTASKSNVTASRPRRSRSS